MALMVMDGSGSSSVTVMATSASRPGGCSSGNGGAACALSVCATVSTKKAGLKGRARCTCSAW